VDRRHRAGPPAVQKYFCRATRQIERRAVNLYKCEFVKFGAQKCHQIDIV
jgi:hypothetical protein